MPTDILERLRIDAGQRTLGQIIQEREAAAVEIERLRSLIGKLPRASTRDLAGRTVKERSSEVSIKERFRPGAMIRLKDVCEILSISRSTIYKKLSAGEFPEPVHLGPRTVRWRLETIEQWRDER